MSRRRFAAAVIVTLITLSAGAAELPLRVEERLSLRALFERAPGVVSQDGNGITVEGGPVEVVVAQFDSNGRLVKMCVNSEEAALRFFEKTPAEKKEAREK